MTKRQWLIITVIIALFSVVVGAVQWWKYANFGYNGLDLGIYGQVAWSLSHGLGFASSIHDPSYLGDHLELWLVPMSWLYRLAPSPLTLLWIQTLIIASAILPLSKLAGRIIGGRAAVGAAVIFAVHPLILNSALYEFHGLVVALPLLLWSIWWYLEKRYWLWVITLLLLVVVREDTPFVVAGWSLMAAIDRRSWRWWLAPIVVAGTWFPAAQTIIRAANYDGLYKYLAFYSWLGDTPMQILSFPFRHPWVFIQHIVTFNNLGTIIGLVATFGLVPFARVRRLWPLLLPTAQLLIGNAAPGSYLRIHYTIPYLPFLAWAAMEAIREARFKQVSFRGLSWPRSPALALAAVVGVIYTSLILGPLEMPWLGVRREPPTSAAVVRQALADVQPADRVLTTFAYLPNLANRSTLYSLNYVYLGRRQYSEIPYTVPGPIDVAVIDWQQLYEYQFFYKTTVFQGRDGLQRIRDLLAENGLGIVRQYGSIGVYRRDGADDVSAIQISSTANGQRQSLGPVELIGQPTIVAGNRSSTGTAVVVQGEWAAVHTAADDPISVRYVFKQGGRVVWQQPRIIGQGPRPASTWTPGTLWRTQDALVIPTSLSGPIEVTMEIFKPEGRYRLDPLRTFRPVTQRATRYGRVALGSIEL